MNSTERKPKLVQTLLLLLSSMLFVMAIVRHYLEGAQTSKTIYFLYLISLFFIACFFYVRRFKKTETVSFLIVFLGFIVTTIRVFNTGGLQGSAISWYLGIPAIAAFIQGHRWVVPWMIVSILGVSLPLMLPEKVAGHSIPIVNFIVLSLLIIVNSMMMYIFEKQRIANEKRLLDQASMLAQTEKLMSLGTLAGGVAHEINNPLAIIRGHAEALRKNILKKKEEINVEDIQKACQKIENNIVRISSITKNLLVFTQAGRPSEFQSFEVSEVLNSVKDQVEYKLNNIKFTVIHNAYGAHIEANKTLFEQVLVNLVLNSIDAIEELQEQWIKIEISKNNSFLKIEVTDSGHGISSDSVNKIFDPFYTTKTVGKGTGLGLSLCRSIMEMHNGSLKYIENSPHTKFEIQLPLKFNHA